MVTKSTYIIKIIQISVYMVPSTSNVALARTCKLACDKISAN